MRRSPFSRLLPVLAVLVLSTGSRVSADVLLDEASSALAQRDWARAARLADRMIAAAPNSADGYRIRGIAENRLGNYQAALADFASALRLRPDDIECVLGRGRSHRLLKQYDAAVSDFTRAHEMAPQRARPLCERGAILILQHKFDASLADYVAAEKVEPDYPGLYSYFAEIYLYMGRPAEALAATKKGLEREPNVLIYQVNLAHSLLFLGRYEEAKAVYVRLQDVIDEGKQIPGREIVRNDFMLMRAAGISHPDMPRIEAAIGIR